ncbi:MAG: tRNA (5-methylaminomethyl-2-thiouridine)(34)-methyltransferase MnmD [Bacteroidales bacterium]
MIENIKIEISEDSSSTLFLPDKKEHYHSIHGAINEAKVVYIEAGMLAKIADRVNLKTSETPSLHTLSIFEMGFGTALNALLTWIEAEKHQIPVQYTAIEAFPLPESIFSQLNYAQKVEARYMDFYLRLHHSPWEQTQELSPYFQLTKRKGDMNALPKEAYTNAFDLIYYDAFAPEIQAELWTLDCFRKMYGFLKSQGILTTYCAKGQVKRNLKDAGFCVESLAGPLGKREISRARKCANPTI